MDIKVKHPNGYIGVINGQSLSVYHEGNIVLHTSSKSENVKTKEDLYRFLGNIERYIETVNEKFKKQLWYKESQKVM